MLVKWQVREANHLVVFGPAGKLILEFAANVVGQVANLLAVPVVSTFVEDY